MKVLHFISGIRSGGVEQMLINYTELLNDKYEYEEVIVYQHDPDMICLEKLQNAGNKCIRIANKRIRPISNLIETYKIIKKERPEVVHCHMSMLNFFPLIIAKLCRVKVRISHSHTSSGGVNFGPLNKLVKKLNMSLATHLMACGKDAGKYMYGKNKFSIIRNAIDIDKFNYSELDNKTIRTKLEIPDDAFVMGNVGRFVSQKNHSRLIDIFEKFHQQKANSYLIIIGDGELLADIERKIAKLNLRKFVKLVGTVSDVSKYLSAMDLFLLPSLYEGLPVVCVETQAMGVPLVLSKNIDSDIRLLNTTCCVSLDSDDAEWLNTINRVAGFKRVSDLRIKEILTQNGFSIFDSFLELKEFYLEALSKQN